MEKVKEIWAKFIEAMKNPYILVPTILGVGIAVYAAIVYQRKKKAVRKRMRLARLARKRKAREQEMTEIERHNMRLQNLAKARAAKAANAK